MNINTICTEKECEDEVKFYIKTFNINDMPKFLSINTNISSFSYLLNNKKL